MITCLFILIEHYGQSVSHGSIAYTTSA